jgi:hypothetical protein
MASPFPGMDPFIEVNPRWEGFHAWFVRELAQQSMPKAQELGCWIDVKRTIYQREVNGAIVRFGLDPATLERVKQDFLVVREVGQFPRALAVVEVLSPATKTGRYVLRYREKRMKFLTSRAHFMEIDLLRRGPNPSRQLFPELPAAPYFIFVARKTALGRTEEGFPLQLQDPLPVIGLPIGPPRADLPLDLAAAFQSAYDLSIRPGSVHYAEETPSKPPLSKSDAAWVKHLTRAKP